MRRSNPETPMPINMRSLMALIGMSVLLASCATVREVTYPRDFVYLEKTEITSDMQAMAVAVDRLDRLLADSAYAAADRQGRILDALTEIERISSTLAAGAGGGNHALINNNIDGLRELARNARVAAEGDPPVYYPAGRLAGQCLACHVQR